MPMALARWAVGLWCHSLDLELRQGQLFSVHTTSCYQQFVELCEVFSDYDFTSLRQALHERGVGVERTL